MKFLHCIILESFEFMHETCMEAICFNADFNPALDTLFRAEETLFNRASWSVYMKSPGQACVAEAILVRGARQARIQSCITRDQY